MRKTLKIIGLSFLLIILLLAAVPFLFESQIENAFKTYVNKNFDAKVDFANINLSLLRSFPKARLSIDELSIVNNAPFQDEILATSKYLTLEMPIKELFKNADDTAIVINEIILDEALVTLKTDVFGNANYEIIKSENSTEVSKDSISNAFTFDIKNYSINKSAFNYLDEESGIKLILTEINHSGKGNFSGDVSELVTTSEARLSLKVDSTIYLNNNTVKLDAIIDLDLKNELYTFKNNTGFINGLPLQFSGSVKNLENGQYIDINFENPESSFKDFLAVFPSELSKNVSNVATTGNFKVNGNIKGDNNNDRIPNITINISSNNASFKYPDLPKSVDNISIDAVLKNETGQMDDTFLRINKLNFKIDEDQFNGDGIIKNLSKNMLVNANIAGVLNLANITKAYPIKLENALQGILKGKLNSSFDMNAIETNAYDRIKNRGNVTISNFEYSSEEFANPITISSAAIDFKPGTTTLQSFNAVTGTSDISATGSLKNLMGFLLSNTQLKGDFNVNSNSFAVNDFMKKEEQSAKNENKTTKALKIPSFLDANINVTAKTVIYDNLRLKDLNGILRIKDEIATLNNVTSNLFNGKIVLDGNVDTTKDIPKFNMNLGIAGFDISESFGNLPLLQSIAPIAKIIHGKLNSSIRLSGELADNSTPKINSISGDAIAELVNSNIKPNNTELLDKLTTAMSFIDFDKLNLKDLKTKLKFENGQVHVQPFKLTYEDIDITIKGSHGFDKSLNYNAVFNVPAKYLGSDINRLIGKINDSEVNNISIPVIANITGTFTSPSVSTDLTNGITNLTKQLIEIQKQKLVAKGKNELKDIISGILGNKNSTKKDSINTGGTTKKGDNPVTKEVGDAIDGIFGKKSTPKDTIQTDTSKSKPPKVIKDILGDVLGNKKNKKTTNKDSIH